MKKTTAHSEYGQIQTLLLKRPEQAFVDQPFLDQEWERLNFLQNPQMEQALREYERFEGLMREGGPTIHFLPYSADVTLDSIYCRDAALVTDYGVILCRMGKVPRTGEPHEERKCFEAIGQEILGEIKAPGTLEGGDVAWLNETTLAVGHTYRTNYEGIQQLKTMLERRGIEVLVAEMPHYRGPSDVFHLMSVFSPVDQRKAVVYSPLMPIHFREELLSRGFELVEVPDNEFDSMGCNVLAIAPGKCVMVKGNPITKERLLASGCEVLEYAGEHISVLGGGGPTCLTRPVLRAI